MKSFQQIITLHIIPLTPHFSPTFSHSLLLYQFTLKLVSYTNCPIFYGRREYILSLPQATSPYFYFELSQATSILILFYITSISYLSYLNCISQFSTLLCFKDQFLKFYSLYKRNTSRNLRQN